MTNHPDVTLEQLEKAGFVNRGVEIDRSKLFIKDDSREIHIHYLPDAYDQSKGSIAHAYEITKRNSLLKIIQATLLRGFFPQKQIVNLKVDGILDGNYKQA